MSENLSGRTIASYKLLERIGEGGTSMVYRADHPDHGPSAVKILKERMRNDETAVKRFLREAGYGARVEHPAVIRTFDFGDESGLYYLAQEWAEGDPLSDWVEKKGRLDLEQVVHIVGQLAEGLTASHAEGIIHRDLKPDNIIFDPDTGTVKLLDFGIARDAQQDAADRLTRTGFFVGTLNYVAPEALSGELVDESADLYSVATIVYYLLTGKHPYTGSSPRVLFQQLLTQDPTPLNEAVPSLRFPEELAEAVMSGLRRDPKERPPSVQAFAAAIQNAPVETGAAATRSSEENESGGLASKLKSIFGKKKT